MHTRKKTLVQKKLLLRVCSVDRVRLFNAVCS